MVQFAKDYVNDGRYEGAGVFDLVCGLSGAGGRGGQKGLYLAVMKEYEHIHDYGKIEEIGKQALEKIEKKLVVRSETALKAAYASDCLQHREKMMMFCWESFLSEPTVRNFLRLFGIKKMAEQYGSRGKEIFEVWDEDRKREDRVSFAGSDELRQSVMGDTAYHALQFFTSGFEKAKEASKNPKGSLGWSGRFIGKGLRLFLLYLYERPLPSKAAAGYVGFSIDSSSSALTFENEIAEESRKNGTGIFWTYFKRWKPYFPMESVEKTGSLL